MVFFAIFTVNCYLGKARSGCELYLGLAVCCGIVSSSFLICVDVASIWCSVPALCACGTLDPGIFMRVGCWYKVILIFSVNTSLHGKASQKLWISLSSVSHYNVNKCPNVQQQICVEYSGHTVNRIIFISFSPPLDLMFNSWACP